MKNLTKKTLLTAALLTAISTHSLATTYAYEASADAVYNKEFKEGDFNPYWFQEEEAQNKTYAYEASADAVYNKEFKEGDFNPYWFQEETQVITQNKTKIEAKTKIN